MMVKLTVMIMMVAGVVMAQLNSGFVQQAGNSVIASVAGQHYNTLARSFVPVQITCIFHQVSAVEVSLNCVSVSPGNSSAQNDTLMLNTFMPTVGYAGDASLGLGQIGYQFYSGGYFQVTCYGHQLNGVL